MSQVKVTLNGIPVEKIVEELVREEIETHRYQEVKCMAVKSTLSKSRSTSSFRNHSGARSGRGRVIFTAAVPHVC